MEGNRVRWTGSADVAQFVNVSRSYGAVTFMVPYMILVGCITSAFGRWKPSIS